MDFEVSSILFYSTRKTLKLEQTGAPGRASVGPLRVKGREGIIWTFNIHSVAKYQKIERAFLEILKIFQKKCQNAEKTERGDPLVLPGIVCYGEKWNKMVFLQL